MKPLEILFVFGCAIFLTACLPELPMQDAKGPVQDPYPDLRYVGIGLEGELLYETPLEGYCVLDRKTGLMWTRYAVSGLAFNDTTHPRKYQDICADCWTTVAIENFNSSGFCGYDDWRLPNDNALVGYYSRLQAEILTLNDCETIVGCTSEQMIHHAQEHFYQHSPNVYWTASAFPYGDEDLDFRAEFLPEQREEERRSRFVPQPAQAFVRAVRGENILPLAIEDYRKDTTHHMEMHVVFDAMAWNRLRNSENQVRQTLNGVLKAMNNDYEMLGIDLDVRAAQATVLCTDPWAGSDAGSDSNLIVTFSDWLGTRDYHNDNTVLISGRDINSVGYVDTVGADAKFRSSIVRLDSNMHRTAMRVTGFNLNMRVISQTACDGQTDAFMDDEGLNLHKAQIQLSSCNDQNIDASLASTDIYDNEPGSDFLLDDLPIDFIGCNP